MQKFAEMDVNQHFGKPPCTRRRQHAFKHNTKLLHKQTCIQAQHKVMEHRLAIAHRPRDHLHLQNIHTHRAEARRPHKTCITQVPMHTSQIYKPNLHHNHMHSVARRVWDVVEEESMGGLVPLQVGVAFPHKYMNQSRSSYQQWR